jgi:DNA excision repair protein ERCC-2
MRFQLDGLDVFFPYDYLYKEQFDYMLALKQAIDERGHFLLEMPTGTGKTVCLISLITSYQLQYPKKVGKLIYCTRTVPEMSKCMEEIKKVIDYRISLIGEKKGGNVLALCLSSRRNMCINSKVMEEGDREAVDSLCRNMTASWIRAKAYGTKKGEKIEINKDIENANYELCEFYENYDREGGQAGKKLLSFFRSLLLILACFFLSVTFSFDV